MLCEECGKNQATVAITVSAGGEVTTRRLCPECMKKMQFSLVSGDIQGFLSSVLSVLGSGQKVEEHTAVCSGCSAVKKGWIGGNPRNRGTVLEKTSDPAGRRTRCRAG